MSNVMNVRSSTPVERMFSDNALQAHPGHSLAAHLLAVGNKAEEFAQHFEGGEHARLAGLLHDLGKTEPEFQKRVNGEKGDKQPHAHHGAALVFEKDNERGGPVFPVAFAINGHHAGLHNRSDVQFRHR